MAAGASYDIRRIFAYIVYEYVISCLRDKKIDTNPVEDP